MSILDKLNTMVHHIKEATFPLEFVGNKELPPQALEELGKITSTWLDYTSQAPKEVSQSKLRKKKIALLNYHVLTLSLRFVSAGLRRAI